MKSIKGESTVECPNGCESFDAEYWTLIRGDQDAELKESLLGGELNLISCPTCGEIFYHDKDFIYFDPPKQILAFVSPKTAKENFEEKKQKMKKDFEFLRKNLAEMDITYDPFYLFGIEELKALLDYEDFSNCQSEVIAACASQKGLKVAVLNAAEARLKGYPLYLPFKGSAYTRDSVKKAAQALFAENPALTLLNAVIKDMNEGKDLPKHL